MTYKLPEPDDITPGASYPEYSADTLRSEVAKATAIFDYAVNFVVGTGRSYTCTTEGWTMVDSKHYSKHYSNAIAAAEKRGAAQREAELMVTGMEPFNDWPEYNANAMGCGLEDYGLQTQPYEAMQYGWEDYAQRVLELGPFYTAEQLAAARLQGAEEAKAQAQEIELKRLLRIESRVDAFIAKNEQMQASSVNQGLLDFAKLVLRGLKSGAVKSKPIIELDPDAAQLDMRPLADIARTAILAAAAHTGEQ